MKLEGLELRNMKSGQPSKIKSESGDLVRTPVDTIKETLHLSLLPVLYVQGYSDSDS